MNTKEIIKTLMAESVQPKHEYSDIDPMIDDVYNRINGTATTVKNMLITAYRNDEEKGMKDLDRIYSMVEDAMEQLMLDVEAYTKGNGDEEE